MEKNKENVVSALTKASTHPDGTMGMDPEELDEIADFLMEQTQVVLDPKDGSILLPGKRKPVKE